jgi:hypothetical protein
MAHTTKRTIEVGDGEMKITVDDELLGSMLSARNAVTDAVASDDPLAWDLDGLAKTIEMLRFLRAKAVLEPVFREAARRQLDDIL